MTPGDGYSYLRESIERKQDDRLFQRWVNGYQDKMSLDDFRKTLTEKAKPEEDMEPEDILEKVKNIIDGMHPGKE